jgi:hypothetical protein
MPLDWTFSFMRVPPDFRTNPDAVKKPEIMLIASYHDGKPGWYAGPYYHEEILQQMESALMLLTYIAFFPGKDFIKVKLRTSTQQYALHFLDKRFLDHGLLACFSVSEYGEENPFESWGVEEMMSEYIFEYFFSVRYKSDPEPYDFQSFHHWLTDQVADFFLDREEGKQEKKIPVPNPNIVQEYETLSKSESDSQTEHWWDIQLINDYGQPLTSMISFIDKLSFEMASEQEEITQSLESMSLAALKIILDQQGAEWSIEYLKSRLHNEMGFQYTFFKKFLVNDGNYLLIMNSSIYNYDNQQCLQIFKGNEQDLLLNIAKRLKLRSDLFAANSMLVDLSLEKEVLKVILDCVDELP